ncbi:MAG: Gfo/Idh/MocA family oxidoreductase [Armatimonadota bacterium]
MKNIAVIGSGGWGLNIIRNFAELDKLAAVCDINKTNFEKLEKEYPGIVLTKNIKDIIKDKSIEGVVVVTPPATHFKLAKKLILAGKNVWVEKPVALKSRDAKKLWDLSLKKNKIAMAGHTLLYNPAYLRLKQLIDEGYFGDIYHIYCRRLGFGKVRKNENVLWSLSVHDIAAVLYLTGTLPVEVSCIGASYIQKGTEDIIYANLKFEGELTVNINSNWLNPYKERKLVLTGSEASAVIDEMNNENPLKIYNQKIIKLPVRDLKQEYFPMHKENAVNIDINNCEMLREECRHFIDCIEKNTLPRTDAKSGYETVKILERCTLSMKKKGRWVKN